MLLLTLYVDVLRGPLWVMVAVVGAYYTMLLAGVAAPLLTCSDRVTRTLPPNVAAGLRFRLRAIATYLLLSWHAFPLVWGLDTLGLLSPFASRMGYLIADVLAKFLPITLYFSVAFDRRPEHP